MSQLIKKTFFITLLIVIPSIVLEITKDYIQSLRENPEFFSLIMGIVIILLIIIATIAMISLYFKSSTKS